MTPSPDPRPVHVQSDALDADTIAELEAAFEAERPLVYRGTRYLVQKVEEHVDPGAGTPVRRYALIPVDDGPADAGDVADPPR